MIKQRTRYFMAVEGESESAFIRWLQELSNSEGTHVYLDSVLLRGGGYLRMLDKAISAREVRLRSGRPYRKSFLVVDSDLGQSGADVPLSRLEAEAAKAGFTVFFQYPCHEGLLARLHPGKETIQPPDTRDATRALKNLWSEYDKPQDYLQLGKRFTLEDLIRCSRYDPGLKTLLLSLGFKI